MNIYATFDENPAITQVIKKTKRYGRTHGRTHGRTDNVKTVYPTTNKVCGGHNKNSPISTEIWFWTDKKCGRMDDAKTITLRLWG